MLWLTHYIIFTQTTQLAAAPSPAVPVDSIVFVGSFRLILYTNSLRQNRNRNRNRRRWIGGVGASEAAPTHVAPTIRRDALPPSREADLRDGRLPDGQEPHHVLHPRLPEHGGARGRARGAAAPPRRHVGLAGDGRAAADAHRDGAVARLSVGRDQRGAKRSGVAVDLRGGGAARERAGLQSPRGRNPGPHGNAGGHVVG